LRGLGQIPQAQQEYQRAQAIDANRADVYYNLGVLNMSYLGNTIPDLQHAEDFLNQFVSHAGQSPRYADAVARANHHIHNIRDTITAIQATGGATSGGAAPAAPAGGATPATPAPTTPAPGAAAPAPATTPAAAPAH